MTEADIDSVVDYVYMEDRGREQFYIARNTQNYNEVLFIVLDKHGIYNIFRSITEYENYQLSIACERICVEEDPDLELPEGVDTLDVWLYNNILDIDKAFKEVKNDD